MLVTCRVYLQQSLFHLKIDDERAESMTYRELQDHIESSIEDNLRSCVGCNWEITNKVGEA